MSLWRMVLSAKKARRGEAFILHGNTFVLKVYHVGDAPAFAHYLVDLLNADVASYQAIQNAINKEQHHERT